MVSTGEWVSTARLAMVFDALGCTVDLVSLKDHPALATGVVKRWYLYKPLRPLASLRDALKGTWPDAIIPVDELSVLHLKELCELRKKSRGLHDPLQELISHSLGGAMVLKAAYSRMVLLEIAREQGVPVPETLAVASPGMMTDVARQLGLPMVLKADATSGGRGVRVVQSVAEAAEAWEELTRPPSLPRAAWRAAVWRDRTHFRTWARKEMRGVTAQRFLSGGERTAMAVAHRGELLSFISLEVVKTWKERGPSSVVKVVDDPAMELAMRRVLRELGASGFCGFDFMMSETGTPLLIEMNPRPTQLAHLTLGEGRDLVAAYVRALLGKDVPDREAATSLDTIALFPQEMQRDPQSPYLLNAYHDVPWESPELIRGAVGEVPSLLRDAKEQ